MNDMPMMKTLMTYSHVTWDNWFSEEDLQKIEDYCKTQTINSATIISGNTATDLIEDTYRKSDIGFIHSNDETRWIFDSLLRLAAHINNNYYGYDLSGFDHFQYTEYNGEGSKYDYHTDMIFSDQLRPEQLLPRKLSFSLILSNPNEYIGGDFEILIGKKSNSVTQTRGRVIAFPSFVMHRVTPLTSGVRKSIVFWAVGPKFK
jgi:PKHD-type hydroxylase